ncbi:hypothetical protein, variant 2 [Aphanomyces astaci]|nr:hypothetical protein, variant 2 [Aphanomyces astaci]ETV82102.1 hypothetical protein, variant 2 [Aphanomyces astaci]|eukprot:XP_009828839.1 hypothetical protein, variant 2 [Aphanomyces astaci]
MKLSPNLRSPNVRNESQAKSGFCPSKSNDVRSNEPTTPNGRTESSNPTSGTFTLADDMVGLKTHSNLPAYSPSHIKHLQCPTRVQTDPSYAVLQQAIRDCAVRVCSVKYGGCAFSRAMVPHGANDVVRDLPSTTSLSPEKHVYLPYTTRKPQSSPPVPPLTTLHDFMIDSEANSKLQKSVPSSPSSRSLRGGRHLHSPPHSPHHLHIPLPHVPLHDTSPSTSSKAMESPATSSDAHAAYVDALSKSLDGVLAPLVTHPSQRLSSYSASSPLQPSAALPDASPCGANNMPLSLVQTVAPPLALPPSSLHPHQYHSHLHGIERLQLVIAAREDMKQVFSHDLLAILRSLDHGRWTCFCLKYAAFHTHRDLHVALFHMNDLSETTRRQNMAAAAFHAATWFTGLLAVVAKFTPINAHHTAPPATPPPACAFVLDTIRQMVESGYEIHRAVVCSLVLCMTESELQLESTQAVLMYLRSVVQLSLDDWERFFASAHLQPPREVLEHRAQLQHAARKRSKMNFAKIKQVIRTKGMMEAVVIPRMHLIHRQSPTMPPNGHVARPTTDLPSS